MFGAVEACKALAHRGADEAAILPVGPAVIRAGDGRRTASGAVQQPGAAMSADVVERADPAIAVPQHQHAVGPHVERHVVAGSGDRIDVADDLPARQNDPLQFEPRHVGIVVHPRGQRMDLAARAHLPLLNDQAAHRIPPPSIGRLHARSALTNDAPETRTYMTI